jgi:hypothetical protein
MMKASRFVQWAIALSATTVVSAADAPWPLAGQQGIVRFVIVPTEQASDAAAYRRQVQALCEAGATCFLNFYTNSTGAPAVLPLPDAIERENTAIYRRSVKQGAERLIWRCGLKIVAEGCF